MRYAANGYANVGYFLQAEEALAATALTTCLGIASAYSTLQLSTNAQVVSATQAGIYLNMPLVSLVSVYPTVSSNLRVGVSYNSDGYNTDGYFLACEQIFSANPKAVATSLGVVNSSLSLVSNGVVTNSLVGGVYSTANLLSNAIATSILTGSIYSTLPIYVDASAFAPTQATAAIRLDMYVMGQPTVQSGCLGGVVLRQTLLSNAQINTVLAGNVNSKMGLFSYSHSQSLSIARLTFPSLYVGDLGITSLTPTQDISSLTPINYIGLFN